MDNTEKKARGLRATAGTGPIDVSKPPQKDAEVVGNRVGRLEDRVKHLEDLYGKLLQRLEIKTT